MKSWSSLTIASILRDMEGNPSFMDTLLEGLNSIREAPLLQHMIRKVESDEHAMFRLSSPDRRCQVCAKYTDTL